MIKSFSSLRTHSGNFLFFRLSNAFLFIAAVGYSRYMYTNGVCSTVASSKQSKYSSALV